MGDKMENRHADAESMMSGHSLSGPTWAMESHPSSISSKYLSISYLSLSNPSLLKPSVSSGNGQFDD
jgi:hypothetical protein